MESGLIPLLSLARGPRFCVRSGYPDARVGHRGPRGRYHVIEFRLDLLPGGWAATIEARTKQPIPVVAHRVRRSSIRSARKRRSWREKSPSAALRVRRPYAARVSGAPTRPDSVSYSASRGRQSHGPVAAALLSRALRTTLHDIPADPRCQKNCVCCGDRHGGGLVRCDRNGNEQQRSTGATGTRIDAPARWCTPRLRRLGAASLAAREISSSSGPAAARAAHIAVNPGASTKAGRAGTPFSSAAVPVSFSQKSQKTVVA